MDLRRLPFQVQHVIIGAGLAGAATAYWLSRLGARGVLMIEREDVPGFHASGRNAAMIRQIVAPTAVAEAARRGRNFLAGEAASAAHFRPTGSWLIGDKVTLDRLMREQPETLRKLPPIAQQISAAPSTTSFPWHGTAARDGLFCPGDGVVEPAGLLEFFLKSVRSAGHILCLSSEVLQIHVEAGAVVGVSTSRGEIPVRSVINASGAWMERVNGHLRVVDPGLRSFRRHLGYTGPIASCPPDAPFVWDVEAELYYRPESSGLLVCACDHDEMPPADPPVDPRANGWIAEKFSRRMPGLGNLPLVRTWAGLRTFTRDRSFVIGPDPWVRGLTWVGGLGGHGVTCAPAVGEIAARSILGVYDPLLSAFSPVRFVPAGVRP